MLLSKDSFQREDNRLRMDFGLHFMLQKGMGHPLRSGAPQIFATSEHTSVAEKRSGKVSSSPF
jgi:hypothetical protein